MVAVAPAWLYVILGQTGRAPALWSNSSTLVT